MTSTFQQAVVRDITPIVGAAVQRLRTRPEVHAYLQQEIAALARRYGYHGEREYPVEHYGPLARNGYIDAVWMAGGRIVASFEIDSSMRAKSVQKLVALHGGVPFWVYYGRHRSLTSFLGENDPASLVTVVYVPGMHIARTR